MIYFLLSINNLIIRAVDEDLTRDLFLTKEVLYH